MTLKVLPYENKMFRDYIKSVQYGALIKIVLVFVNYINLHPPSSKGKYKISGCKRKIELFQIKIPIDLLITV